MKPFISKKTVTAGGLMLAMGVALAGPISADSAPKGVQTPQNVTNFRVDYTGSLFIFPMGTLSVVGQKNDYAYSLRADMESSGLAKMAKAGGLWSTSTGYYTDQRILPKSHIIQKLNDKGRRIEMEYDATGNPTSSIEPRFGSMGVPPASDQERREAVDALSGILQLMMTGHKYGDKPCTGNIPVFDGKQRYDLRLEPAGDTTIRQRSYSGPVTQCHVYMDTVSGYDPEDLLTEEEASTPLVVYLANFKDAGFYVPVRFDYRVSGIKVNIRATNIEMRAG